jgi:hypothetical protein
MREVLVQFEQLLSKFPFVFRFGKSLESGHVWLALWLLLLKLCLGTFNLILFALFPCDPDLFMDFILSFNFLNLLRCFALFLSSIKSFLQHG